MQLQRRSCVCVVHILCILCVVIPPPGARSGDGEALLALKSSIDPSNSLQWGGKGKGKGKGQGGMDFCKWEGIKECMNGRVTKLVVEEFNLSGKLEENIINQLDELRVLSFKDNNISGQIPKLSGLFNLKSLYLNNNNFSGQFPNSLTLSVVHHRLKVIVLSGNQITGPIPDSLLNLPRLYILYLEDNRFTGGIPPFNQTTLTYLNLSNNLLSGEIPPTPQLLGFNASSFSGNIQLCGLQIQNPCINNNNIPNSPHPHPTKTTTQRKKHHHHLLILGTIVGGFVFLSICLFFFFFFFCKIYRKRVESSSSSGEKRRSKLGIGGEDHVGVERRRRRREQEDEQGEEDHDDNGNTNNSKQGGGGGVGFSWEGEGLGRLVFLGASSWDNNNNNNNRYSLEELLKASAETLGRGTMGSTYKAVMESGFIVTVKRLKDSRYPTIDEFRTHLELHIGTLTHPNLVPLRAYFQAKEERLLVYDYFPNGSLFSLIHGSRGGSGGGKPLHWTSCLKIAEDLATGLLYIHQNPAGLTHGNLKSSNVLLGSDFESCLTDYGLTSFRNPDSLELESSASSLFYRAPECRDIRKTPTQKADVYSFGVVLLELLTGKTPFQDLVQEHGSNIPMWVRSVREEETESGGDDPIASSNDGSEEKLMVLLNIAMACVSLAPENRPTIREVLRMIREARAEAQVSSNNSSDHSPGRWSDTVQSLPREEEHLSI